MKIKFVQLFSTFFLFLCFTSCSTPSARFVDTPQVPTDKAVRAFYVGPFIDLRKGGNVDTTILGTIRGGYGNPLARVRDERGSDEFLRENIMNTARTLFFITDRKPDSIIVKRDGVKWIINNDNISNSRLPILVGIINQLIVETGFSRGTVVDVDLELIDPNSGKIMWRAKLLKRESGGMGSGIFESTKKLKGWLAKTVQDETLNILKNPEFENQVKLFSKTLD